MPVYGNPAQGYALEPGKKVDAYGYVEGSQHYNAATPEMKAANPNPNPSGGGFVGGSSTPVNVTAEGVSVGGAKPVPQTPNIAQAPGFTASNSNVALSPEQQQVTGQYNAQAQAQNQDIQTRARQAFEQVKNQPITQDASGQQVARTALGQPPKPSIADNLVQTDPYFADIQKMAQDYFSPTQQRQSLTQEYQNLLATSGIQGLDTELLNMKTVLEGTEDDIRNEVVKAGGFATESQVMALTNARNKQLIKNYNNLLETRNAKEQYLDKMMSLSSQDRQEANQRFDSMMNIGFKLADYQQKMQQNAQQSFQKVVDQVGFSGVVDAALASGDPKAIAKAEALAGVDPGMLIPLAELDRQARSQAQQKAELQNEVLRSNLETDAMQRRKLGAEITEMETPVSGVPPKILAKVQSSPEYKTINAILPSLQTIKAYKDAITTYGSTETFLGNSTGKGTLKGTYGNALSAWKSLAGLGALSGADFALAENAIPEPGFWQANTTMTAKLDTSLTNAITQAETLTRRLSQNFPEAAGLLQQQLDEMKMSALPPATLSSAEVNDMDALINSSSTMK